MQRTDDDARDCRRRDGGKELPEDDARTRELIQKTVLGSLNRATDTIERVERRGARLAGDLGGCRRCNNAKID